jgi:hypothetical protein
MELTFKQLAFLMMIGSAIITPHVMSAEPVDFKLVEFAKPIDLSKSKLLLEITRMEVVSKKVQKYSDPVIAQAVCRGDSKNCDPSEEDDRELEARRFDERWWEDGSGDEWYEKTEYHKYDDEDTWEEVGTTKVREGALGFVSRPKG